MPFPVEVARILAAEAALGRKLPIDLRARLMRDNGGEIAVDDETWWLHPVWDPGDRRRIARTANHVVVETRAARAIANNGSGDLLIVRAQSDAIERWDHETGEAAEVEVAWR